MKKNIDYDKVYKKIESIKKRIKEIMKFLSENFISVTFSFLGITSLGNYILEKAQYEIIDVLYELDTIPIMIILSIGIVLIIIGLFLKKIKKAVCIALGGFITIISYNFIFGESTAEYVILNLARELMSYRVPMYLIFFISSLWFYMKKK